MKITALSLGALLLANVAVAQLKEGTIIYERKTNMHKRMPPQDERMKNMIPEFITDKTELLFSGTESLSRPVQKEEDLREHVGEQRDAIFISAGGGVNDEVYKNYATAKLIESKELGPKKYLLEDSLKNWQWKIDEKSTKTIKGYTCKKAISKSNTGETIIAWYTEQIQCPSGPENYGGLPGMILELSMNEGEITYTAVDVLPTKTASVKAPNKGKKITREDFEKIVSADFGGRPGGSMPIRIAF